MKRIIFILFIGLFFAQDSSAQGDNKVLDGVFIKETAPTRRVIPYTHVREADVTYYKRVWRMIDLKEKINHPLYYPTAPIKEIGFERLSLFDVIKQGVEEGTLTAYDEDGVGGQFQKPLPKSEAIGKLSKEIIGTDIDPETGLEEETSYTEDLTALNVKSYRIKEDWFFDRERSIMEVRIIGILPVVEILNTETGTTRKEGLFWIYFPEARYVFANHEVYNRSNDGSRLTFEDLFRKRVFSGFIYKETNVYDNRILDDYTKGIDRLLEAQKIQEEIINFEHDMWQY
ncbi:MAG: gliding motility protein GldN [Flavobacteriales bacterium]|nr:gliding motility protein GldN [Flavobacteriales bacterium]